MPAAAPALATTFPANGIGPQMKMIARMIGIASVPLALKPVELGPLRASGATRDDLMDTIS